MMPESALNTARALAGEYGHVLEPANYVRGVGISGRLRLGAIDGDHPDPVPDIRAIVEPSISAESFARNRGADGSVHSGFVWTHDLTAATRDERYIEVLRDYASLYLERRADGFPAPIDPDRRVEDIFFTGALLGRAFEATSDEKLASALIDFLRLVNAQPDTGLWLHCGKSPYYWGRGNGFAALGFAEALSYLPLGAPEVADVLEKHRSHLQALLPHQDSTGAWRQLINEPDAYLELTSTAMIGYAFTRGLRLGWLGDEFIEPAERAWSAVAARVDRDGMVSDSCTGTGPLATLDEYRKRKRESGHDDRGGSLALWFAVERMRYEAGA